MSIILTYMKLTAYKKTSGFTLVELLIVIAVIGVLAAVILVVINPLEQIARGRDAGRINSITQIGNAMQAYAVGQEGAFPADAATWMDTLVTAGELKGVVVAPANTPVCGAAANQATGAGGICYAQLGSGTDGVVWMITESASSASKVPSCTTTGNVVAAAYIMSQGKAGLTCLATAATVPTAAATLY